ncbi:MAG: hypothetical protein AAFV33_04275 [Chloroflexota bacterium]
MQVHRLENKYWQAGILPEKGGSILFGRIRFSGIYVDVIRPTPGPDFASPGSFLMLPWANRIRDGVLRFDGETYQLQTTKDDGTARHGDVRKRPWQVDEKSETSITLSIRSTDFDDFNFPFALSAQATYALEDADFLWRVTLTNEDDRPFPAGFGFHPYFQHTGDNMPLVQIPCDHHFELTNSLADAAPVPVPERLDFRKPRAIPADVQYDDLLTGCDSTKPIRLLYRAWNVEVQMLADKIFKHVILFAAPDGTVAVEPQTNANDGFNLYANGIDGSGVFVVKPGASITGEVRLRIVAG